MPRQRNLRSALDDEELVFVTDTEDSSSDADLCNRCGCRAGCHEDGLLCKVELGGCGKCDKLKEG